MKVPGQGTAFSLYTTYIPQQSAGANNRNVLTGYLAANSDAGGAGKGEKASGYGKLTLLTLPKTDNIPGPGQVQSHFNGDSTVSQELNILKRGNSTVKQGNLLTLPVGGGFLYVQPVYVQSTSSGSYPLLQKVLVALRRQDRVRGHTRRGPELAVRRRLRCGGRRLRRERWRQRFRFRFGFRQRVWLGHGLRLRHGLRLDRLDRLDRPSGSADNDALQKALADAKAALQDRQEAYADNDLVAAAEADQRLQDAIEAATAAENGN